jgi:hypothetical protein
MGFQEQLQRSFRETAIHRRRQSKLLTVGTTELPYVLLGESVVNVGDTVVRRGIMRVDQPAIFLFQRPMQFEGFEGDAGETRDLLMALGRAAHFPPGRYSNIDTHLEVFEGALGSALEHYERVLEIDEDVLTGLLTGPVDLWQLSLLVYAGAMIAQNATHDMHDLIIRQALPHHWS